MASLVRVDVRLTVIMTARSSEKGVLSNFQSRFMFGCQEMLSDREPTYFDLDIAQSNIPIDMSQQFRIS